MEFLVCRISQQLRGGSTGRKEDIGKELIDLLAERAAHAVKLIKDDEEAGRLQQEFFAGGRRK